jgi:ABC-type multidrug transport system ATPase subunit
LLLGLQQPDAGSVRLFGQSPLLVETRRQVGVMMQEVALPPELRVREHIDLVTSYYPAPLTPRFRRPRRRTCWPKCSWRCCLQLLLWSR